MSQQAITTPAAAPEIDAAIRRLVAAAPPLAPFQRDKIATLARPNDIGRAA